jgi:hypothetical protein
VAEAVESVDLANCYDAIAYLITSTALQSFKVCKVMVAIMLCMLEMMTWYLKTACGQSEISFGRRTLYGPWPGKWSGTAGISGCIYTDDKQLS